MTDPRDYADSAPSRGRHRALAHRRRTKRSRLFRLIRAAAIVVVSALIVVNGVSVAQALAAPGTDSAAARLAEWARDHGLGWAVTGLEQASYGLTKPRSGGAIAGGLPVFPSPVPVPRATRATTPAPAALTPLVSTPLAGEGVWNDLYFVQGLPAARVAFLRPDSIHTSYYVQVIWMDPKLVRFTLTPGYTEPGPAVSGQNQIPPDELDSILATFNSGFRMADSRGGYWQNGTVIVPLRAGAASMVFTADGQLRVEAWPGGAPGPGIVAVRQNLDLLIQDGVISREVYHASAATWGSTVGNAAYVWRSAIGVRADGSLISVVGPAMDIGSLANILKAAGAVNAMELDINPDWTNYITYAHPAPGEAIPTVLPPPNSNVDPHRYLQPSSRDFVSVLPLGATTTRPGPTRNAE